MTAMSEGLSLTIPSIGDWTVPIYRNSTAVTMDAAGEMAHSVGQIYIPDGGSKTISAAGGGCVTWFSGSTVTLGKSTTHVDIGIQDVSFTASPARGDGTFDVKATLDGTVDSVSTNTYYETPMETGTKTITDGDDIAIVHHMTGRGSGDSMIVSGFNYWAAAGVDMQYPILAAYTGTWTRSTTATVHAGIKFDDGTYGYLLGGGVPKSITSVAYNSGSTPDEIGNLIAPHQTFYTRGIKALINLSATTSPQPDFEVCLYENPLGSSPTLLEAITVSTAYLTRSVDRTIHKPFSKQYGLVKGKTYAVTIRPTTATSVTVHYWSVQATGSLEQDLPGATCYAVSRTDNSGAFSEYSPSDTANCVRMSVALMVDGFDVGDRVIGSF